MTREAAPRTDAPEAPPPLLGAWSNLYILVLAELGALVLLFSALTWWAS